MAPPARGIALVHLRATDLRRAMSFEIGDAPGRPLRFADPGGYRIRVFQPIG